MPLSLDHRKILIDVLRTLYTQRDDFAVFLRDELGKILDEITSGDNLGVARSDVVDHAERYAWTPDLIAALLKLNQPAITARLQPIGPVEDIREAEARLYDECYVDRFPLVNRKKLREKLRSLATDKGKRILLVKGSRSSGNSHALRHIRNAAVRLGIPLAEFPLRNYVTGEELRPYEFGADIAEKLDLELPARLDAKATRWSVNFVTWLSTAVDPGRSRLWIAFDDFEREKLKVPIPDSIYEFIQLLSDGVANRLRGIRLFLVNYDRALPNELSYQIDREDVPQISEEDIADFFLEFHRDQLGTSDIAAAALDAAQRARSVTAQMTEDSMRLHQMRDALTAECERLLKT